jgi:putative hydrolase of the HAD superfamily
LSLARKSVSGPGDLPVGERLSGLVFDLDGTLYLQRPVQRAMLWRLVRAGLTHPASTWRQVRILRCYRRAQEHLRSSSEPLAEAQLRMACDWSGVQPEEALAAVSRWMEDAPLALLEQNLRPGVVDLLEAAQKKGIRIGLLSDYPATKKLLAMGIDTYFSTALCAQDVRVGVFKPSPKGIAVILADLGVDPARAVYIGDRPSVDGAAAWRAGIPCVILGKPLGSSGQGWIGVPDVPSLRALLAI